MHGGGEKRRRNKSRSRDSERPSSLQVHQSYREEEKLNKVNIKVLKGQAPSAKVQQSC